MSINRQLIEIMIPSTYSHRAAVRGYTPLVKLLIDRGSRLNPQDSVSNTPLYVSRTIYVHLFDNRFKMAPSTRIFGSESRHLACQDEHGETALALLEAGADQDRQNGEGRPPFQYCTE